MCSFQHNFNSLRFRSFTLKIQRPRLARPPLPDRKKVGVLCVVSVRALCTACALTSHSQTLGNMSARIQYQPFQQ